MSFLMELSLSIILTNAGFWLFVPHPFLSLAVIVIGMLWVQFKRK